MNSEQEAWLAVFILAFTFLSILIGLFWFLYDAAFWADSKITTVEEGCKGIKYKDGKFEKILDPGSYKHHKEKERIYVVSMIEENSFYDHFYSTSDEERVLLTIILKVQCQDIKLLSSVSKPSFYHKKHLTARKILFEEAGKIIQKIKFTDLIQDYSLLNKPLFEVLQNYFPSQTGYTLLELDSILIYYNKK